MMSSVLSAYQEEIFDALINKGWSYSQVSTILAEKGVHITRQSIHSWHTRLCKKIAARKEMSMQAVEKHPDITIEMADRSDASFNSNKSHQMDTPKTRAESIKRELEKIESRIPSHFFFPDLTIKTSGKRA